MTAPPAQEPWQLQLHLDDFEGPLDLLLHLIRRHELSILDIPIAFITAEYLRYLEDMEVAQLDVAGEYLVMAATLLHIKSRTLLPRPETDDTDDTDGEFQEDPREALIRRLLELQRFQDAGNWLATRSQYGRDRFFRPSRAEHYRESAGPAELLPATVYQLLRALTRLAKEKKRSEVLHEVTEEKLSMRDTLLKVVDHLNDHPRSTFLQIAWSAWPEPGRRELVIVFLSLLELAKLRVVKLFQSRLTFHGLVVERAVIDKDEVSLRLEGLEEEDA